MSPWGQIADLACAKILEYKNKKYKTTKMENKKRMASLSFFLERS